MRKLLFWIYENKGADQLRTNCYVISAFVFRYRDSAMSLLCLCCLNSKYATCSKTTLVLMMRLAIIFFYFAMRLGIQLVKLRILRVHS